MRRGMILAAGRGERMKSLTENTPKPLLKVGDAYLIEYSIRALVKANIRDIVINVSYRRDQIIAALGDGSRYGAQFYFSEEPERLETGGGIVKALPLLGSEPFVVLSSDVICDYPLETLFQKPLRQAHLIMVENPPYHPNGDYCLNDHQEIEKGEGKTYTFGNICLFRPELFQGLEPVHLRLAKLWEPALLSRQITGECYRGLWYNVGTPHDLELAHAALLPA